MREQVQAAMHDVMLDADVGLGVITVDETTRFRAVHEQLDVCRVDAGGSGR